MLLIFYRPGVTEDVLQTPLPIEYVIKWWYSTKTNQNPPSPPLLGLGSWSVHKELPPPSIYLMYKKISSNSDIGFLRFDHIVFLVVQNMNFFGVKLAGGFIPTGLPHLALMPAMVML